jgi:hypothetical protein
MVHREAFTLDHDMDAAIPEPAPEAIVPMESRPIMH